MHLKGIKINFDKFPTVEHYPFKLPIFCRTRSVVFCSPLTFFIGENGTGKSTLLEAITRKCNVRIWQGFERTRYKPGPYEKEFYKVVDIEWENGFVPGSYFSSQIFRNFAQLLDEWAASDPGLLDYFGGKSLMAQSHGQSLMSFFKTRFKIKGLYLLDEPETALSPKSQLALLNVLKDMSRAGHAQFIVATHSPILLACPGAKIYSFDHVPLRELDYEETDYYRIYKSFMSDREQYLGS